MRVELQTTLDNAIYRSDREQWAEPEIFDGTKSQLALALDTRDRRRIYLAGCYGGIGCGSTEALLIADDETERRILDENEPKFCDEEDEENTITEADAFNELPEGEPIPREDVTELQGTVWDGNNHVDFHPGRAEQYCDEEDIEPHVWGIVTYDNDSDFRFITHAKIDPGWVCLGWDDTGGWDTEGAAVLTQSEFNDLFNSENIPAEIETFTEDACEVRAMFARKSDLEKIRAAIKQTEDED